MSDRSLLVTVETLWPRDPEPVHSRSFYCDEVCCTTNALWAQAAFSSTYRASGPAPVGKALNLR